VGPRSWQADGTRGGAGGGTGEGSWAAARWRRSGGRESSERAGSGRRSVRELSENPRHTSPTEPKWRRAKSTQRLGLRRVALAGVTSAGGLLISRLKVRFLHGSPLDRGAATPPDLFPTYQLIPREPENPGCNHPDHGMSHERVIQPRARMGTPSSRGLSWILAPNPCFSLETVDTALARQTGPRYGSGRSDSSSAGSA
jgi:hypothetical protein